MSDVDVRLNHFLEPTSYVWEYDPCTPEEEAIVAKAAEEDGPPGRLRALIELGKVKRIHAGKDVHAQILAMFTRGEITLQGGILVPAESDVFKLRRPLISVPDEEPQFWMSWIHGEAK